LVSLSSSPTAKMEAACDSCGKVLSDVMKIYTDHAAARFLVLQYFCHSAPFCLVYFIFCYNLRKSCGKISLSFNLGVKINLIFELGISILISNFRTQVFVLVNFPYPRIMYYCQCSILDLIINFNFL